MDHPTGLLHERDDALIELNLALARARAGHGELALVTGEAGAGKTSVIREFLGHAAGRPVVLHGVCDPLAVPRPLGPLIDAAGDVDPAAAQRLGAGISRVEAFAIAQSLIDGTYSAGRTTVFVIEDLHWADDATLDLLTFLGRRVRHVATLLLVSYRDDEVSVGHSLRDRLGELGSTIKARIHLHPLSQEAVAQMASGSSVGAWVVQRQDAPLGLLP